MVGRPSVDRGAAVHRSLVSASCSTFPPTAVRHRHVLGRPWPPGSSQSARRSTSCACRRVVDAVEDPLGRRRRWASDEPGGAVAAAVVRSTRRRGDRPARVRHLRRPRRRRRARRSLGPLAVPVDRRAAHRAAPPDAAPAGGPRASCARPPTRWSSMTETARQRLIDDFDVDAGDGRVISARRGARPPVDRRRAPSAGRATPIVLTWGLLGAGQGHRVGDRGDGAAAPTSTRPALPASPGRPTRRCSRATARRTATGSIAAGRAALASPRMVHFDDRYRDQSALHRLIAAGRRRGAALRLAATRSPPACSSTRSPPASRSSPPASRTPSSCCPAAPG